MTSTSYKALLRNSIRVYFAPLVAIWRSIKAELHRAERDHARG